MKSLPRPPLLALLLSLVVGAACGATPSARIVLQADFPVAEELSHLELTVAAARDGGGTGLCAPSTRTLDLDPSAADPVSLPVRIRIRADGRYDRILYVRVRGYLNGMLRLQMEHMVALSAPETTLPITLTAACLGVGTGAGHACIHGTAVQSPYAPIFDQHLGVETSEPCLLPP